MNERRIRYVLDRNPLFLSKTGRKKLNYEYPMIISIIFIALHWNLCSKKNIYIYASYDSTNIYYLIFFFLVKRFSSLL